MADPKTVLNGDQPESNTLRHLLTIPAVQDSVRVFSSHPVGKVSIQLTSSAYQYVGAPVLNLFSKPLAYVAPYARRADDFGVQTLAKVEEKYPGVKKTSPELYQDAREAALAPVKHVSEVYQGAYQRTGGNHTIASGKAAAKTAVVVSLEGGIFVVREALRLGESFRVIKSIQGLVDQLEEAVKRRDRDAEAGPAVAVNGPRDEPDHKEASV